MSSLGPDDHLDPRQFGDINRDFYTANPADYFRLRIEMLTLAMGRTEEMSRLLVDGVEWRDLKFSSSPDTPGDETARRREAVGIADAEVIYHHVAECLLRLVIAHVGLPPCPQLEVARVRSPGEFKRRIRAELIDRDLADVANDVWPIFFGGDGLIAVLEPQPSEAEVEEARVAAARWTQHFAYTWLDRAAVYNTAKHGFALSAGEGGLSIGPMGPQDLKLERFGTVISYIDRVGEREDQRWAQRMTFVDPEESLGSALVASTLIDQLWSIARSRYVGTEGGGELRLFKDDLPKIEAERAGRLGPYQVKSMTSHLLYLAERPSSMTDSRCDLGKPLIGADGPE